jgi:LytS/YehU family sensor histidine kinase
MGFIDGHKTSFKEERLLTLVTILVSSILVPMFIGTVIGRYMYTNIFLENTDNKTLTDKVAKRVAAQVWWDSKTPEQRELAMFHSGLFDISRSSLSLTGREIEQIFEAIVVVRNKRG